ncbi:MAG: sensor domain-containing diguanylate cyclase [Gammaproteobacteria bacterium]|nr:sensor domain-containing diguanylate cyclase [Gammaproteobacteria bacterium]
MMVSRDADLELRRLKERLVVLTDEAAKNEIILRRSQARELDLLNAQDLPVLLRLLTQGLADSYGLNAVTLLVTDPDHRVRHLLMGSGHSLEAFAGVHFVDSLTGMAPQFGSFHKPWLGPYLGADHQLVFPSVQNLRSIALMPLRRQERPVGSLNFGSSDPARFTRHHATDFLNHLATIASFCLENGVNRALLVRSGVTDVLTGWHNRRYLQARLQEELARARRDASALICLLLDVDHFKKVNDTYGHLAGDNVLKEIAARVNDEVRESDVAARFGGEEFAILLPDSGLDSARRFAERVRAAVSASPIDTGSDSAVTVTVSIGIASIRPTADAEDLKSLGEQLLAEADVALYRAKAEGRDRVAHNC